MCWSRVFASGPQRAYGVPNMMRYVFSRKLHKIQQATKTEPTPKPLNQRIEDQAKGERKNFLLKITADFCRPVKWMGERVELYVCLCVQVQQNARFWYDCAFPCGEIVQYNLTGTPFMTSDTDPVEVNTINPPAASLLWCFSHLSDITKARDNAVVVNEMEFAVDDKLPRQCISYEHLSLSLNLFVIHRKHSAHKWYTKFYLFMENIRWSVDATAIVGCLIQQPPNTIQVITKHQKLYYKRIALLSKPVRSSSYKFPIVSFGMNRTWMAQKCQVEVRVGHCYLYMAHNTVCCTRMRKCPKQMR